MIIGVYSYSIIEPENTFKKWLFSEELESWSS